jgi:trk system potassium uptake protein TrkA
MKVIVVGAGVLGFNVAKRLSREDHDVVVVDVNQQGLERVQELLDAGVVHGKGSSPSVLREAGLETADMLVAVTGSDETNVVACLLAETLAKRVVRVARLRDPEYRGSSGIIDKSSLSIDLVISPEEEMAESVGLLAATPGASDVLQFADGRVRAVGAEVDAGSPLIGRPLTDLRGPENEKSLVAGVYRGERVTAPQDAVALTEGDTVFFVATPDAVRKVFARLGKPWIRTRHAMIFGGGRHGTAVARRLADAGVHTKIIERDLAVCATLADHLTDTVVLHGDGLDQALLADEGVHDMDMFVAAVSDEKENVFAALLARRLGARRVVALVDTPEYIPFAATTGVDVVLSPMLTALGPILQLVRRGQVISVRTLKEEIVEGIEFIASPSSDIVGMPLALLHLPRGSLVGAVVRNDEVIVPHGSTVVEPGDRVILFARPHLVPRLQNLVAPG